MSRKRRDDVEAALPTDSLKAALWYTVAKIVEEEELAMQRPDITGDIESNASASEAFVAALVELLWSQLQTMATDVDAFSTHAGRKRVQVEDVLLLARRNPALEALLRDHIEKTGNAPPGGLKDNVKANPDFVGEAEEAPKGKARAKPVPKTKK